MEYVRLEEVLALHAEIKGIPPGAARDHVHRLDLLESALERPRNAATYGEVGLAEQAATLMWGLVKSHPFVDGNKRTALLVTRLFIELNRHALEMSEDEKFDLVVGIANGGLTVEQTAAALRRRVRPRDEGRSVQEEELSITGSPRSPARGRTRGQ